MIKTLRARKIGKLIENRAASPKRADKNTRTGLGT